MRFTETFAVILFAASAIAASIPASEAIQARDSSISRVNYITFLFKDTIYLTDYIA
jgi:hypothetical protein